MSCLLHSLFNIIQRVQQAWRGVAGWVTCGSNGRKTAKDRPPALTDATNDRVALVRIMVNLVTMLGHVNADVILMRQEAIKPVLKPEFQKICHATIPPN